VSILATARYRPIISKMVMFRGLPRWSYKSFIFSAPIWLEGLILQESAGDPKATRYEPHQDRATRLDSPFDPDLTDHDDGMREDDKSYGLMQIMGYNLRNLTGTPRGTSMDFQWAFDPEINILIGTRLLRLELDATGQNVQVALARYNGGPSGNQKEPLRTQPYVDRIFLGARRVSADL